MYIILFYLDYILPAVTPTLLPAKRTPIRSNMSTKPKRKRQEPMDSIIPLEDIIIKGEWLTDEHINFAQGLLQQQFPNQDGFFNPLCGQVLSFPITRSPFLTILHWVRYHFLNLLDACIHTIDEDNKMPFQL